MSKEKPRFWRVEKWASRKAMHHFIVKQQKRRRKSRRIKDWKRPKRIRTRQWAENRWNCHESFDVTIKCVIEK